MVKIVNVWVAEAEVEHDPDIYFLLKALNKCTVAAACSVAVSV